MTSEHHHPTGLRHALDVLSREASKFGVIGLLAFIIDTGLYNLLMYGPVLSTNAAPEGVLGDHPLTSKVVATAVATAFAWLGNRYWTFRKTRRANVTREAALFILFNILGLLIALICLWFSHYVLGFRSQLADNISGNGVGLVLGTLFRFWAYRTFVFTEELGDSLEPDHDRTVRTEDGRVLEDDDSELVRPYGVEEPATQRHPHDAAEPAGPSRPIDTAA